LLAVAGALFSFSSGSAGAASSGKATSLVCSGGPIAAGTYTTITIRGFCLAPPGGTIVDRGWMSIAPGAGLEAINTTLWKIHGTITVGKDAIFAFGCGIDVGCKGHTIDTVGGNLTATDAAAVISHGTVFGGNVVERGGGGGVTCKILLPGGPNSPPLYSTYGHDTIDGKVIVSGLKSCWFGLTGNTIRGTVSISHNTLADADAMELVTNTIYASFACTGNSPAPHYGDSHGLPNVVKLGTFGQCTKMVAPKG
jgi:hypothetical protein